MNAEINLLNKCNAKCIYCPRINFQESNECITDKIILKIKALPFKRIIFSGYSEPTLHPRMIDFINIIEANKISINTNAILWKNVVDALILGVDVTIHKLKNMPENYYKKINLIKKTFPDVKVEEPKKYLSRCRMEIFRNAVDCDDEGRNMITDMMTIDYDGDVLLCCNDWEKSVRFGNIMKDDFEEIIKRRHHYKNDLKNNIYCPCNYCELSIVEENK